MKILALMLLGCALCAETPQERVDAQWLKKYHQLTANVRKAQQARNEFVEARIKECETRGGQLMQDGFQEPSCQSKPTPVIQQQPPKKEQ